VPKHAGSNHYSLDCNQTGIAYLKGSVDYRLLYRKGGDISLNVYCDSNWAGKFLMIDDPPMVMALF
jgi:hypothetical protein